MFVLKSGHLLGRLAGPAFLAITLGACLAAPASVRLESQVAAASGSPSALVGDARVPSSRPEHPPAVTPRASGKAPSTTVPPLKCPPIESPVAACRPCLPVVGTAPRASFCPPCPPVLEGARSATVCPTPLPPVPPAKQPPVGHPAIVVCPSPVVAPQPGFVPGSDAICGSGFHSGEGVVLTASGSRGSFAWTVRADAAGSFQALLPPALCRLLPLSLVATGSSGDRSNTLTISGGRCLGLP